MSIFNPGVILYDAAGNPVGTLIDGEVYRLQTETKMSAASPQLMDSADMLRGILNELGKIRTLLEILTDETVKEGDIEL